MNIVNSKSFRSDGTLINKTDDMIRLTVDLTREEYKRFPSSPKDLEKIKKLRDTLISLVGSNDKEELIAMKNMTSMMINTIPNQDAINTIKAIQTLLDTMD